MSVSSRARHLVLVVLDTARADAFEPYGAPQGASPAVRDLARRGWAAGYAVAPSSWTLPSHVAMLLGQSHRDAGLVKARQTAPHLARPVLEAGRRRYLPAVLSDAGWRTTGASTNLWVQASAGFDLGFDAFHALWANRSDALAGTGRTTALRWAREGLRSRHDDGLTAASAVAQQWVDGLASGTQPQFLFLNLTECHSPYLPPRPYNDLGPVARVKAGLEAHRHLGLEAVWRTNLSRELPPPAALDRMRHLYARSARYLDDWLGAFLASLEEAGALDDTVVVVTSDHGENLGEAGRLGHSFSLDERLLHVPLVALGTDADGPEGAFGMAGLPALLARELGLPDSPYEVSENGTAVARVEGVGVPDDPQVLDALQRWGLGPDHVFAMTSDAVSASDGRFKVVQRGHLEQVLDLVADPLELAALDEDQVRDRGPEQVRRLRREVAAALRTTAPSALPPVPDESPAPDGQLADQMRLLGYL